MKHLICHLSSIITLRLLIHSSIMVVYSGKCTKIVLMSKPGGEACWCLISEILSLFTFTQQLENKSYPTLYSYWHNTTSLPSDPVANPHMSASLLLTLCPSFIHLDVTCYCNCYLTFYLQL